MGVTRSRENTPSGKRFAGDGTSTGFGANLQLRWPTPARILERRRERSKRRVQRAAFQDPLLTLQINGVKSVALRLE